jgi:hypothetical protein
MGLFVQLPCFGCGASKSMSKETKGSTIPSYSIVIRFIQTGNAIDIVMDVFSRNGLMTIKIEQTYLSTERQEMIIIIKGGKFRQLSEAEHQLRNVMNIESVSIQRL